MLSGILVTHLLVLAASAVAQSSLSVVCVAGQCLQGFSNTTIGATLSASGSPAPLHLLPGQYTSTTNPQLLHNLLTSSSAALTPSPGFSNATSVSKLPLNLDLDPGVAVYSSTLYSGQSAFSQLPSAPIVNTSVPLDARSIALSSNVWIAVSPAPDNNNGRVIIWDSVPNVSQLPFSSASLSLLDMQSSACSPPCSSSGTCSSGNACVCPPNFTGSSCESCASGFFGPTCQPCPSGCAKCDDGSSGTGRCLTPEVPNNAPEKCGCLNGVCSSAGGCQCNPGWIDKEDGTKCGTCAPGFFQTSTGDCQVCQLGCSQCADITGACIACKTGFSQDPNDPTKCTPVQAVTSTGTLCPDKSFSDGQTCNLCSSTCGTCNGPTSNDCIVCATGQYVFNGGSCVPANTDGVCEGTGGMIADNNKKECDTCGAKCTSCKIPNFTAASTVNQLQCTGCLPGFVLSNGKCVDSCPAGSFVSPQDGLTCIPCSSSCGTCAGSADFCLSCNGNLLASSGKCVSTCPSSTFPSTTTATNSSSSDACLSCHSDCATCSGPSFNQCTACPSSRPVLSNGRCLPTCSKSQFFDATTNTCQPCDGSCDSCLGSGANRCLACSSSTQVLSSGTCVAANCNGLANVIPGLGVCLSDLVQVPSTTGGTASPLPTITGLGDPTIIIKNATRRLEWWEILLMALGCAFIFIAVVWCWRRKAKKDRKKRTEKFARVKKIKAGGRWNWASWKWFGRNKKPGLAGDVEGGGLPVAYNHHDRTREDIKLGRIHNLTKEKDLTRSMTPPPNNSKRNSSDDDLESYIDAYDYSRRSMSIHSRTPSTLPDIDGYYRPRDRLHRQPTGRTTSTTTRTQQTIERESIYSEVTGVPRHTPEPRVPLRRDLVPLGAPTTLSPLSFSRLQRGLSGTRQSMETTSSVVIQPELKQQREGTLVDFDGGNMGSRANATLPLQLNLPLSPPLSQQDEIMGLTKAQEYVETIRPGLWTINISNGNTNPMISTPVTNAGLGSGTGVGMGGSYWMQPSINTTGGEVGVGGMLRPINTGSSGPGGSKNPFRQG